MCATMCAARASSHTGYVNGWHVRSHPKAKRPRAEVGLLRDGAQLLCDYAEGLWGGKDRPSGPHLPRPITDGA